MTKMCSYCLNSPRLTTPPGVIVDDDHTKFDCPVCQENRVLDENEKESIDEFSDEELSEENLRELLEEQFYDVNDIDEDYEEEDEDFDQF